METSRDRVLKAIDHIQPDTTPVNIMGFEGLDRWLERFNVEDDFGLRESLGLDLTAASAVYTGPNAERGLTIWGTEPNAGGYEGYGYSEARGGYPLAGAASAADVEGFDWPDPEEFDYEVVAEVLRQAPGKARCVRSTYSVQQDSSSRESAARGSGVQQPMREGAWFPIVCSLFNLFGMEEALVKLRTEPMVIEAAISHLEVFILEFTRRQLEATRGLADIYWYGDDFSTQRGIMISPEDWRRFVAPTYRKVFELVRGYGLKVWFHSCGTFRPVLPDLVDMGIDVWETVQVHLPGNEPEVLKREYGQDIAFYGAINTQQTLPYGTTDDVRAEVRERVRVLGKGGGYICGSDHAIMPDVPMDNVLAMVDEARRFSW